MISVHDSSRSLLATLLFGLSAMACEPPVPPPIQEPDVTRSQQERLSASEALNGAAALQDEREEDLGSAPEESLRLKLDPSLFPQGGPGVAAPRLNPPSEELKLRPPEP